MLTKAQKKLILDAFKEIDVKKLEISYPDERATKWFRFGSYVGIDIATHVVKSLPEKKTGTKVKVS